ncbi:MAG: hypothetical protein HYR72_26575 [Deltaproteobacteria bacterium]|nr:hypothetical protein [Deltaproteobacteria bacterium]MBI3390419.1 hypothetical protein [Deltaproteobacteria bacterium]
MPKKKSLKKTADRFIAESTAIDEYVARHAGGEDASWTHEYAVLRLYRAFEQFVLEILVGAVNNDTTTLSSRTGIAFPKHLTDEVCEYLVVGDGYFDFRGRDGLIKTIKEFVPDGHYLVIAIKDAKYKDALERLSALRNYAAHGSYRAKAAARRVVGQKKIMCAGDWLSTQNRFSQINAKCRELAGEVKEAAPY